MRRLFLISIISTMFVLISCSNKKDTNFVLVEGGLFVNTNSEYYEQKILLTDFYISKYEVTQKEWKEVMGTNPSGFLGENLPVEMISWYDSIEYCNKRSEKEGLIPYYNIDKVNLDQSNLCEYDDVRWTITVNPTANGYRLPTEVEWEYAASGGQSSKNYMYSGGDKGDDVAWYWRNAGDSYLTGDWYWPNIESNKNKTNIIGLKKPNELGIYDMSGNVREWCFDWYEDANIDVGIFRVWKGGGWIGDIVSCESTYKGKFEANGKGADQGLRVCRNK